MPQAQASLWVDFLSAAIRTGGKMIPGVSQAISVIESVETKRECECRHTQTLAAVSRVERSITDTIEREMKAVLDKLCLPKLTPRELEEEISNLYDIRRYGREPFLAQGLLANSHWYEQLRTKPNLYGRVLQDSDKPSPECFYIFIDADKTRLLEVSPFALQHLLAGQSHGVPAAKVIGQSDLFAARLPKSMAPTPESEVVPGSFIEEQFSNAKQYSAPPKITIDPAKVYTARIETTEGTMNLELYPKDAPRHVNNWIFLAKDGFYHGLIFHRVIPGFMIQGGDPTGTGTGGPGYKIRAEFNKTKHVRGVLSMARTNDPDSAGSQFFLMHRDSFFLDGQYTAFGKITTGIDVVDRIADAPRYPNDRPQTPARITKVTVGEKVIR
ncbi:MAG TPA: peptidylprolyl isomerase [Tepidisphaeraceae bacterium]|jgi:cyclophilin family peptidyl-prolyl cis-trans isomerase|nr:peptidylprolyl isomerase [Tepidisphaeraceae bacterium]